MSLGSGVTPAWMLDNEDCQRRLSKRKEERGDPQTVAEDTNSKDAPQEGM